MAKDDSSPPSPSAVEDVSVGDPLPFDPSDEAPEPIQPVWLWARLRTRKPEREVWERVSADEAPKDALAYRAADGPTPDEGERVQRDPDLRDVVRALAGAVEGIVPRTSEPEMMTVEETAALLRINTKTAYEKVRRGEVPGGKYIGGVIRVSRAALLDAFRQPASLKKSRRRA